MRSSFRSASYQANSPTPLNPAARQRSTSRAAPGSRMCTAQKPMRVRGKRRMASKITSCWRRQRASRRQGKPMTTAAVNPGLIHGRHHLLRPHQFGLGRLVQQAEGRFIGEIILPVAADFLRKDMGVTIQNHLYTMALNVQRRKPFLRRVTLGKTWFFSWVGDRRPPVGHFPLVYPLFLIKYL